MDAPQKRGISLTPISIAVVSAYIAAQMIADVASVKIGTLGALAISVIMRGRASKPLQL